MSYRSFESQLKNPAVNSNQTKSFSTLTPPHFPYSQRYQSANPDPDGTGNKIGNKKIQDDATKAPNPLKASRFHLPQGRDLNPLQCWMPPRSADRFINLIYN